MFSSRLAAAATALALVAVAAPAAAKKADAPAAAAPGGPDAKNISKGVRPLLQEAQKLEAAGDNAGALTQVRAAEAVGNLNSTDQFFIAQMKLGLGSKLKDDKVLEEGIKGSVASEFLPPAEKPKYIRNLAAIAIQRNDYNGATADFEQLTALPGASSEDFNTLAQLYAKLKQDPQAIAALQKAIVAAKAAGKTPDENLYRTELKIAVDAKLPDVVRSASVDLVTAYPNPTNWRDALLLLRDSQKPDDQGMLDIFRLMQSAGALNGEADYSEFVELLINKGLPGEAKTVVADGIAKGMLSASKGRVVEYNKEITAKVGADRASLPGIDKEARSSSNGKVALGQGDAYFGYGDYAKAAEMYRLALTKSGVDPATANLRLGASLARSGDKAGATTAFQAVQGGNRAPLAQYWLIWLGQKA